MTPETLTAALVDAGTTLGIDRTGQLVADGTPDALAIPLALHATDIALLIAGRRAGHRWAACTACHRPQVIPTGPGQACKMTPGCKGRLKATAKGRHTAPLAPETACARPGCLRPAERLTHALEPLCVPCTVHLAALTPQELPR